MKFNVFGNTSVVVCVEGVEADTREEAIKKAKAKFGGIHSFAGNGGCGKLIGVNGEKEAIHASEEVDFDDAMEI